MSADGGKEATVAKGLKGIKAADSSVSLIEGDEGRLLYRGYHIDDLAENASYEEVAYLLLNGELPNQSELKQFQRLICEEATLPAPVIDFLKGLPTDCLPMSALRSAVSVAGNYDPDAEDDSEDGEPERLYRKCLRLVARVPTIVAAIHRLHKGEDPVSPNCDVHLAASFMEMLKGDTPTDDEVRAMDLILILHAEHGFNASTFTARVIAATLSDCYSAITGAVGALKGKLHGGANTEVLRTLKSIGSVEGVQPYVEEVRARKGKFMGFGHAVYQTEDPRAKHLKELSKRLGEEQNNTKWYDMSIEMERLVVAAINRQCNVDFYSASLQHYLGIPEELFTCIFASSRISGWCAHVLEQLADNKIIRPSANYIGPAQRNYVPADQR